MAAMAADLIARYDNAAGDASAKWRELMLTIGSVLAGHVSYLPPALLQRLNEVNSVWAADAVSTEFLLTVKLECWAFLRAKHEDSGSIVDREDRTIRALLALVEPPGDRTAACDNADWVEEMLGLHPFPRNTGLCPR